MSRNPARPNHHYRSLAAACVRLTVARLDKANLSDRRTTLLIPNHAFAIFSRDTTWQVKDGTPVLSRQVEDAGATLSRGGELIASDDFEVLAANVPKRPDEIRSRLERASEIEFEHALRTVSEEMVEAVVRLLTTARYVARDDTDLFQRSAVVAVTIPYCGESLSVACSPYRVIEVTRRMTALAHSEPQRDIHNVGSVPMIWNEGSGALLLHEALGHPVELNASLLAWPDWLHVFDDPISKGIGSSILDDCGDEVEQRELTAGQGPSALRRESFRDVPMRRMTNLRVEGSSFPVELPHRYVDIFLAGRGRYDRVTDEVSLRVLIADLVHDSRRTRLHPFALNVPRKAIPQSILGAIGDPVDYPGVICSDEGQQLPVGSASPILLTAPLHS